ncbi:MAG: MFS transporter [Nitrospinae bacterium]|nr:MFS transporter [Nitrospinota bacterium]
MQSDRSPGYCRLLKNNPDFRNLWYGQVVSELGDWLNSVAIYTLILQLDGSGMALAIAMMAKLLPFVVVSPIAGAMIDRMSRKKVMIAADILRFFAVIALLLVKDKDDLWLLYALVGMEIAISAFFEPARSAIIPSITAKSDLVTANSLSGTTWSAMLAVGAALGGVVAGLLGIEAAFVIDACTFLLSAVFISRIAVREAERKLSAAREPSKNFRDLIEGGKYLLTNPVILALSLSKTGLAVAGGIMTLIPLYANGFFSTPADIALGIGVMYFARGVGAAIGPLLVKSLFGDSPRVLRTSIGAGFFLKGASYMLFAAAPSLLYASLSLGLATVFGSIIWVFSSSLLHLEAEDRFLGRVFSWELATLTLVMGLSNWAAGFAIDHSGLTASAVAFWIGASYVVPGVSWIAFFLFARDPSREREIGLAPASSLEKKRA